MGEFGWVVYGGLTIECCKQVGAEYILRLFPKGTHDYNKFIRPSELATWIRAANLNLKESTGLHYNPVTKYYWLAPNVDVNYMVYTRAEA